jgi:hypothetical protein
MVNVSDSEDLFSKSRFNECCTENNLKFPKEYVNFIRKHNDGELDANTVNDYDECSTIFHYPSAD